MSQPDSSQPRAGFQPARHDDGQPAFNEPWQAQALGLAFALTERGVFSASDWAGALGAELAAAEAHGEPDTMQTYYLAVLSALEGLLCGRGGVSAPELDDRVQAWRRAFLATPHGKPVQLGAELLQGGRQPVRQLPAAGTGGRAPRV